MAVKKFTGKDTRAEEMAEAKALKGGKITKAQYIAAEKREDRKEGEKGKTREITRNANAIKSGKMSPAAYAKKEAKK